MTATKLSKSSDLAAYNPHEPVLWVSVNASPHESNPAHGFWLTAEDLLDEISKGLRDERVNPLRAYFKALQDPDTLFQKYSKRLKEPFWGKILTDASACCLESLCEVSFNSLNTSLLPGRTSPIGFVLKNQVYQAAEKTVYLFKKGCRVSEDKGSTELLTFLRESSFDVFKLWLDEKTPADLKRIQSLHPQFLWCPSSSLDKDLALKKSHALMAAGLSPLDLTHEGISIWKSMLRDNVKLHMDLIKACVKTGANIDEWCSGGKTTLLLSSALDHGHQWGVDVSPQEAITEYLKLGASFETRLKSGKTVWETIVKDDNILPGIEVLKICLDQGCDLHLPDNNGRSLVLYAIRQSWEGVEKLIKLGVKMDNYFQLRSVKGGASKIVFNENIKNELSKTECESLAERLLPLYLAQQEKEVLDAQLKSTSTPHIKNRL